MTTTPHDLYCMARMEGCDLALVHGEVEVFPRDKLSPDLAQAIDLNRMELAEWIKFNRSHFKFVREVKKDEEKGTVDLVQEIAREDADLEPLARALRAWACGFLSVSNEAFEKDWPNVRGTYVASAKEFLKTLKWQDLEICAYDSMSNLFQAFELPEEGEDLPF